MLMYTGCEFNIGAACETEGIHTSTTAALCNAPGTSVTQCHQRGLETGMQCVPPRTMALPHAMRLADGTVRHHCWLPAIVTVAVAVTVVAQPRCAANATQTALQPRSATLRLDGSHGAPSWATALQHLRREHNVWSATKRAIAKGAPYQAVPLVIRSVHFAQDSLPMGTPQHSVCVRLCVRMHPMCSQVAVCVCYHRVCCLRLANLGPIDTCIEALMEVAARR